MQNGPRPRRIGYETRDTGDLRCCRIADFDLFNAALFDIPCRHTLMAALFQMPD